MKICKLSVASLTEKILNVAIYQKVVVVFDNQFGQNLAEDLRLKLKKDTQFFAANFSTPHIDELLIDARCVVEILGNDNYFSLTQKLDNVILLSVAHKTALAKINSQIVFVKRQKNLADYLLIANNSIENIWRENCGFLSGENHLKMFDEKHKIFFDKNTNNTTFLSNIFVTPDILEEIKNVKNLSIYLYLRIVAICFLFLSFSRNCVAQIDVYKECPNSIENINICHQLMTNERVTFLLKNQNKNINKIMSKIIQKIKFKNNTNINKINTELITLKNNAKIQKYDNLLKYCYFFGIFNAI